MQRSAQDIHRNALNLSREEGAKKRLPNTLPGQKSRARLNEATQNFTKRAYISYFVLVTLLFLISPLVCAFVLLSFATAANEIDFATNSHRKCQPRSLIECAVTCGHKGGTVRLCPYIVEYRIDLRLILVLLARLAQW